MTDPLWLSLKMEPFWRFLKHEEKDNSTEDESYEMNEDEMKNQNNPNSNVIENYLRWWKNLQKESYQ